MVAPTIGTVLGFRLLPDAAAPITITGAGGSLEGGKRTTCVRRPTGLVVRVVPQSCHNSRHGVSGTGWAAYSTGSCGSDDTIP